MLPSHAEPALRYTAENLVKSSENTFAPSSHEDSCLLFSDGSRVALGVGTQLSLDGIDAHGARMRLVDGALDINVEPRANNAWSFTAGSFRVQVKGTAFRLEYASDRGRLKVQMKHGFVEVFEPPSHTVAVRAGESIELYAQAPPHTDNATTEADRGGPPSVAEATPSPPKDPGKSRASALHGHAYSKLKRSHPRSH